ncbi:Sortilin [Oryzias melastigma]|uniref:Sortilin n=1 Tax=Oryzias melastigma TaxID=30732 RepID=A0A834F0R4_ORYME|nr:Sortilin [Oryzias melastigma]
MIWVFCVLSLGVISPAVSRHAWNAEDSPGLKRFQRDFGAVEDRSVLESSVLSKRSAGLNDQTCTPLLGVEAALLNNTSNFMFKVRTAGSLSLAWVGDWNRGTWARLVCSMTPHKVKRDVCVDLRSPFLQVLLVLTTFYAPFLLMRFGQSNLYRSEDYGKTFRDVTHVINHTFIQSEFGISVGPDHSGKVLLTGDVSGFGGFRLFRSRDFGRSFVQSDLPFEPLIQMLFNPEDCNILLTLSIRLDLWLSEDFGATWRKIHDSVCLVRWGSKNTVYFTTSNNVSCSEKGMLELKKTVNYGRSFQTIATRVYSFALGGKFVFASIMTGTGTERMIHVSVDGGEHWNVAQLPTATNQQFYSFLAANQDMIFMHVDDPGDTGIGTIYVSDDRGIVFSKSLERHLYTTTGSDTDFTTISSLRGVYLTSILTEAGVVETVITYDQGAKWQTLRRPENSQCDSDTSTNRPNTCWLHIHASYSTTMKMNVPMLPLSQPNAVGLILAHGSLGDAESTLFPDVYVSDDGGYTWMLALKGPHHYAILDSGGLLVAVEHTNALVNQIKFSTDEGQCWHTYNFTNDPLHFSGMDSEPGARSMNVSLWGYRNDFSKWVVVTIDFKKLLTRDLMAACLGYKETLLRLRKDSVCWNGRDFVVSRKPSPCVCTEVDYHCDFGFYRPENSTECVMQEEVKGRALEFCLNETTEQLQTSGYRKIPGNQCEGGFQPTRKETDLGKMCTSDALHPNFLVSGAVITKRLVILI